MNQDRYFYKDNEVIALSDFQISEGLNEGLQELTEQELESHLNPPRIANTSMIRK